MRIKEHIFLNGHIGLPDDMWSMESFFTVDTVRNLIQQNEKAEELHVHITSNGGDVYSAFAIYDLLTTSGKKIVTIIEGMVASAATIVALAGSVRLMTKNATLMIHNPWGEVRGDADDLQKAADEMQKIEDRIAAFYSDRTGNPSSKFDKWMKEEKYMDPEEARSLGFVTEVLEPMKAVAELKHNSSTLKNSLIMDIKNEIKTLFREWKAEMFGTPKNLDITDAAGKSIRVDTQKTDPEIGDLCSIDNQPVADGEHIIPALNKTLVMSGGKISEIKEVVAPATDDADKNKDPEEVVALKAQLETSNKKVNELEGKVKDNESALTEFKEELVQMRSTIKSNYVPKERATAFNQAGKKKEDEVEVDRVAEATKKRQEREAKK